MMLSLKELFGKVDFEKKNQQTTELETVFMKHYAPNHAPVYIDDLTR